MAATRKLDKPGKMCFISPVAVIPIDVLGFVRGAGALQTSYWLRLSLRSGAFRGAVRLLAFETLISCIFIFGF